MWKDLHNLTISLIVEVVTVSGCAVKNEDMKDSGVVMSWVELRALSSLCRCQGAHHTTPHQPPGPPRPAPGTVVAPTSARKEWKEMWWRDEEGQVWRVEGGREACRASPHVYFLLLSVDIVIHSYSQCLSS